MQHGITDGSRMLIPLYHGTSRIFLASIREYGLGGKDPNAEFRSLALLSDLLEVMQKYSWFNDESLAVEDFIFQDMVRQRVTGGGFNFRYGGVYLSAERSTAVRYASTNHYGSELLSHTIRLLQALEKHDNRLSKQLHEKYPKFGALYRARHQPLLIEATHVPIQSLRSEGGEGALATIEIMNQHMEESANMRHIMWQQSNFELVIPLPVDELSYYDIEWQSPNAYTLKTI